MPSTVKKSAVMPSTVKKLAIGSHPNTPKLRTPMEPIAKSKLPINKLTAFDDLQRNNAVFLNDTIYNDFLRYVNFAKILQKNYRSAEEERKRLKCVEQEKDKKIGKVELLVENFIKVAITKNKPNYHEYYNTSLRP